eukprot:gene12378-19145_t
MQRAKITGELVGWVNELLSFEYKNLSDLSNGVAVVQVFHSLYPCCGGLSRVNLQPETRNHHEQNFKILQQQLQKAEVDKEFVLANVIEPKKQDLFHLMIWVRKHYEEQLAKRGVDKLDYDAVGERAKAFRKAMRVNCLDKSRFCSETTSESGSLSSSMTRGSSCISGRSTSTYYTASYNRKRAAKLSRRDDLPSYHNSTKSSEGRSVFARSASSTSPIGSVDSFSASTGPDNSKGSSPPGLAASGHSDARFPPPPIAKAAPPYAHTQPPPAAHHDGPGAREPASAAASRPPVAPAAGDDAQHLGAALCQQPFHQSHPVAVPSPTHTEPMSLSQQVTPVLSSTALSSDTSPSDGPLPTPAQATESIDDDLKLGPTEEQEDPAKKLELEAPAADDSHETEALPADDVPVKPEPADAQPATAAGKQKQNPASRESSEDADVSILLTKSLAESEGTHTATTSDGEVRSPLTSVRAEKQHHQGLVLRRRKKPPPHARLPLSVRAQHCAAGPHVASEYSTGKCVVPLGFNFLDPTTWTSGAPVDKHQVVSWWTDCVSPSTAARTQQLNPPPSPSPRDPLSWGPKLHSMSLSTIPSISPCSFQFATNSNPESPSIFPG